jgi:hypothetical protein
MNPLILAAAAYLYSAKRTEKAAGKLQFQPSAVNYDKTAKSLKVTFSVLNPTNKTVKIQSVFGTIFAGDDAIGTIEQGAAFDIKKLGRSTVTIPAKINPVGLAKLLAKVILYKGKYKIPDAKILGEVRSMGLSTAINEKLTLGGL